MNLLIQNASVGYGQKAVLRNVSLHLQQGEVVCILGPNGVGKTTMFRSIMGFLRLIEGEILLDGTPREQISDREFAKTVSYVPQSQEPFFPYTAVDMVVMGCAVHLKTFGMPGVKEFSIANRVMELLGISHLRNKLFTQISGGERQMVLIARALAQDPKLLVMDEPTANLDFGNQIHVLSCIRGLAQFGLGVLMTTHNPDHAFLCCDRVILLTKDKATLEGPVQEIVTEENLRRAYDVEVKIVKSVVSGGTIVKSCVPTLDNSVLLKH